MITLTRGGGSGITSGGSSGRPIGSTLSAVKLDLAWLGGFTYVQARLRTNGGVVPIAVQYMNQSAQASLTARRVAKLSLPSMTRS